MPENTVIVRPNGRYWKGLSPDGMGYEDIHEYEILKCDIDPNLEEFVYDIGLPPLDPVFTASACGQNLQQSVAQMPGTITARVSEMSTLDDTEIYELRDRGVNVIIDYSNQ